MAQSQVLSGANIRLYLNNKVYNVVQSINLSIDYGEEATYGIDAPYPQEISGSKVIVRGSVNGIRVKLSGGLQAKNLRPLFQDFAASSYVSIRIQSRQDGEDIVFIPNAKIIRENHSISTKATYKLNFDFVGQIPLMALDRS